MKMIKTVMVPTQSFIELLVCARTVQRTSVAYLISLAKQPGKVVPAYSFMHSSLSGVLRVPDVGLRAVLVNEASIGA